MPRYFLGVDAGATKTHALILDEEGHVLGFGESGPGNHEVFGFEAAGECVSESVRQACDQGELSLSDLTRCCFSMAGADVESDFLVLPEKILRPLVGSVPFELKNDAFGCLRGGTLDPFGVMINCGTGQVAVGRNRAGKEVRLGGYGFEFGDFSGGSVIAFWAASAVIRSSDGRAERTRLHDLLCQATGARDALDFLDKTYRDPEFFKSLNIPKLVFAASKEGDPTAKRIILDSAQEMAITAIALIRQLEMESDIFDLVTAGSVFKGDDPDFHETLRSRVHAVAPGAKFRMPVFDPVAGAALLALEAGGIVVSAPIYKNLEAFKLA
jgi:N-acetylglucosamine kinase-like BadF-type ATPase